jgi:hypothetical protein
MISAIFNLLSQELAFSMIPPKEILLLYQFSLPLTLREVFRV